MTINRTVETWPHGFVSRQCFVLLVCRYFHTKDFHLITYIWLTFNDSKIKGKGNTPARIYDSTPEGHSSPMLKSG